LPGRLRSDTGLAVNPPERTWAPGPLPSAALVALVAWSVTTSVVWRNTRPQLFESYARVAAVLPEAEVGFVTARRGTDALYSHHALRLMVAPRDVPFEHGRPTSPWLVAEGTSDVPGYTLVRRFPDGVALLRRR
jgi:hypothetical protein